MRPSVCVYVCRNMNQRDGTPAHPLLLSDLRQSQPLMIYYRVQHLILRTHMGILHGVRSVDGLLLRVVCVCLFVRESWQIQSLQEPQQLEKTNTEEFYNSVIQRKTSGPKDLLSKQKTHFLRQINKITRVHEMPKPFVKGFSRSSAFTGYRYRTQLCYSFLSFSLSPSHPVPASNPKLSSLTTLLRKPPLKTHMNTSSL